MSKFIPCKYLNKKRIKSPEINLGAEYDYVYPIIASQGDIHGMTTVHEETRSFPGTRDQQEERVGAFLRRPRPDLVIGIG